MLAEEKIAERGSRRLAVLGILGRQVRNHRLSTHLRILWNALSINDECL